MSSSVRGTATVSVRQGYVAVFAGGLLVGIFDITQAFIGYGLLGARPYRILQGIAGGVFGTRSFQMGWQSAFMGLVFHFTIAFTAATVYYIASRRIRALVRYPVLCGLLYGEAVFLFMHFVVVPLSALGPGRGQFNIVDFITGPIGHPVFVGLPIALCVRHFAAPSDKLHGSSLEFSK